jgi:hypothetical protein
MLLCVRYDYAVDVSCREGTAAMHVLHEVHEWQCLGNATSQTRQRSTLPKLVANSQQAVVTLPMHRSPAFSISSQALALCTCKDSAFSALRGTAMAFCS